MLARGFARIRFKMYCERYTAYRQYITIGELGYTNNLFVSRGNVIYFSENKSLLWRKIKDTDAIPGVFSIFVLLHGNCEKIFLVKTKMLYDLAMFDYVLVRQ